MTGPAVEDAVDLGLIPEEVLFRLGRPDAVADEAWAPGLAAMAPARRASVVAASDHRLAAAGWLDADGRPAGPLGPLADLVAAADLVIRFETSVPGADEVGSGAFLTDGDRVLLLVHDPGRRAYAAQVLSPGMAVAALALGLDPFGVAVAQHDPADPVDVPTAALAEVLPAHGRRSVVRLARVCVRDGTASESLVTAVGQHDGVVACGALRHGGVRTQRVDRDGLVELALALLGLTPTGTPAAGVRA